MCGIVGIFHPQDPGRPVDVDRLRAMTRALAHRGPDGEAVWTIPGVGLGHRRLAVLDPTARADQPMLDEGGELAITFNGEIYNFRELRAELEGRGHAFRTTGDTEVLLAGYRRWGRGLVERISGIYAFAIWDARSRELFLARDPLGVKPLFWTSSPDGFRFASEIKGLLADPSVDRASDVEALDAFFTFSYTPAPRTGFRAVRQLLPGHALRVSANGQTESGFWDVPYEASPSELSFDAACRQLGERLDAAVVAQMVSDVGIGAFLSGGLDSAAVVRSMRRADTAPVRAFGVGFEAEGFDERPLARRTALALGVELEETELRLDAATLLPEVVRHLEEPTADSSSLAVYLLCREAARRHKVVMSGDGADETLAGYDTYRATALARRYRRLPAALRRRVLRRLAAALPVSDRKYGLHQRATRFTYGADLGPGLDHCAWRLIFNDELKQRLYAPAFRGATRGLEPLRAYAAHIAAVPAGREALAGLLHADTAFYLPNDMLVKVDRMSMAHGLEVRVPFLDAELVRWCANLPGDYKLHRGKIRKHVLRESLRGSIPDAVLEAPKSGFNIPVERWMRGELLDLLLDAAATERDRLEPFLDPAGLEAVAGEHASRRADHGHALFTVLMFCLWLGQARRGFAAPRGERVPGGAER